MKIAARSHRLHRQSTKGRWPEELSNKFLDIEDTEDKAANHLLRTKHSLTYNVLELFQDGWNKQVDIIDLKSEGHGIMNHICKTHTHTLLTRCVLFVCGESQVRLPKARSWRKKWEHPSNNTRIDKSVLECDVDFSKKTSTAIRSVECNFLWICCLRMPWSLANTTIKEPNDLHQWYSEFFLLPKKGVDTYTNTTVANFPNEPQPSPKTDGKKPHLEKNQTSLLQWWSDVSWQGVGKNGGMMSFKYTVRVLFQLLYRLKPGNNS